MGSEELLAALRREGDKKAKLIRETAEAEAGRLKDEAAERLALLGEKYAREREQAVAAQERGLLAEAERTARRMRLAGTERLAQRLYALALKLLPTLCEGDGDCFARLARELPSREWERVRVSPADRERAEALFPGAGIEAEPAISGGLEAWSEDGELQVVNTLEKRLERAWPELLPLLLKEVESGA